MILYYEFAYNSLGLTQVVMNADEGGVSMHHHVSPSLFSHCTAMIIVLIDHTSDCSGDVHSSRRPHALKES